MVGGKTCLPFLQYLLSDERARLKKRGREEKPSPILHSKVQKEGEKRELKRIIRKKRWKRGRGEKKDFLCFFYPTKRNEGEGGGFCKSTVRTLNTPGGEGERKTEAYFSFLLLLSTTVLQRKKGKKRGKG